MKKYTCILIACLSFFAGPGFAQKKESDEKVYKTSWVDGVISATGIGLSYWGLTIMNDKPGLSQEYLDWVAMNPEAAKANVPKFDRWAAGNFNKKLSDASDYPFYASFAMPLLFLADDKSRGQIGQIGLLYLETMSITGTLFTHVAGRTKRNRPLVYDPDNGSRNSKNAENSFFAGHTAATASATFFTAKIFNDFFPNSRARPYVWAGAALIPAAVAYGRLGGGKHFLSDNLVGYAVGASVGILVPHLHKISKNNNFTLVPMSGPYDGLLFTYTF